LASKEPAIGDVAVVEPPLAIHDTQPQDPQLGDLDLPLHLHPIADPGPQTPQVEPIPTQADSIPKVLAIRKEVRTVFCEEDDAWAACIWAIPCKETSLLSCRLRVRSSLGSPTVTPI
jgi:hypothetical protein